MRRKVLAIILAESKGENLGPLTSDRCKAAVPFAGKFRVIDFSLSNCINSGIRQINVMVQYKSDSLQKHIRDGWSILNPPLGEYIDVYPPQQIEDNRWYSGTADAIFQNLYTIEQENPDYVLILAGDHIYNMDYRHMINLHQENEADVTIAAIPIPIDEGKNYGVLGIDEKNKVISYAEKPEEPVPFDREEQQTLSSMGIYVFSREILKDILKIDAQRASSHDFGRDIIPSMIGDYNMYVFKFMHENGVPRYWRNLGSIQSYYQTHVDILYPPTNFDILSDKWRMRTNEIHIAPAIIEGHHTHFGLAINSLITGGGIIVGTVKNSILSPNVYIMEDAEVKNSIVFENVRIGKGAKVKNAIIEKNVIIPENFQLGYNRDEDGKRFVLAEDNLVVIPKNTVVE